MKKKSFGANGDRGKFHFNPTPSKNFSDLVKSLVVTEETEAKDYERGDSGSPRRQREDTLDLMDRVKAPKAEKSEKVDEGKGYVMIRKGKNHIHIKSKSGGVFGGD